MNIDPVIEKLDSGTATKAEQRLAARMLRQAVEDYNKMVRDGARVAKALIEISQLHSQYVDVSKQIVKTLETDRDTLIARLTDKTSS